MKKEDLITKWLDNEQLTKLESEAFKKLDVSDSFMKIAETAKKFQAPDYHPEENLAALKVKINNRNSFKLSKYTKTLLRIASIFIIGIGIYFSFFKEYNTHISTLATQKTTIELPDSSIVELNSVSSISYNIENWNNTRSINLEGEAFFKVAKGKKFDVHTSSSIISVIGTMFNVKQRKEHLEVTCHEGIVSVSFNKNQTKYLKAGDQLKISKNNIIQNNIGSINKPEWLANRSIFYATPYSKVLQELAWQYGITITTKNIDKTTLFTGNFVHSNIENALKSITIPMQLKYQIKNKNITLYKE